MALRVCRKHRTLKVNGYCLLCKAEREKIRYDNDPEAQRARKRDEYNRQKSNHIDTGEFMADDDKDCGHKGALAVQEKDLAPSFKGRDLIAYFCSYCGEYLDESGDPLGYDPTEEPKAGASHAGKAPRPQTVTELRAGAYQRDKGTMIKVECSWPECKRTFLLYPQNKREQNWCPQVHQAVVKRNQSRERQQRFRRNHA